MLNIRVFGLAGLATFGVAAALRALGPSQRAETSAAPIEAAPAPLDHASAGAAPSPSARVAEAQGTERRSPRSSAVPANAVRSSAPRASRRGTRSRAVLMRAAAPPSGGLHTEQQQLEVVQRALDKGRGAAAARALDEYGAVLPSGELGLEAELLRIDVALARGERERALVLARAFESRPGAERYKERLAALVGSAAREEPETALMGSR